MELRILKHHGVAKSQDTTEGLNWKQWVLHGPTPSPPPRVDSQLRDMKNGPGAPRKPSGGDQARFGQGYYPLQRPCYSGVSFEPCGSRWGHNVFTCFMPMQTLTIQTGYEICMQSYCDLIEETEPELRSLCSWCHLDLSFTSREMWGYRPGAWHSQCNLESPQSGLAVIKWPEPWVALPMGPKWRPMSFSLSVHLLGLGWRSF